MKNFELHDIEYLKKIFKLPINIKKKLELGNLANDESDALRDLCIERLQTVGFNKDYSINEEGKILEDLIDKLYR